MSKEIARTVGGKRVAWLIALIVMLAALGSSWRTAAAIDPTPTPTPVPAPRLTYEKSTGGDVDIGGLIGFAISVTNTGNADSSPQTVQDTLPGNVDWWIASDTWGCQLSPSTLPGRLVLRCDPVVVAKRHLNERADDFVNGSASVTIIGQAFQCGPYFNVAVFNGALPSAPAIAHVRCPATPTPSPTPTSTPTPTATAPPATSTPAPTATQPPPTPTEPIATPTRAAIPGAPRTGNTTGVPADGAGFPWAIISIAASFTVIFAVAGFIRKRRE